MGKKTKKFPKTLLAMRVDTFDDDDVITVAETAEDIGEEFADKPVAVYQLIAVGKLNVEKSVDAKPIKKLKVGR